MNLIQNDFRNYIMAVGGSEISVGNPNSAERCPIARYLSTISRYEAHVGSLTYRIGPYGSTVTKLPGWALLLVRRMGNQESVNSAPILRMLDAI